MGGFALVAAGLGGLHTLLTGRRGRLARTGWILADSSVVLTAGIGLYRPLTRPPPLPYGQPEGPTLPEIASISASFGTPAGVLLPGGAALRVQGLGRCRFLPLALGALSASLLNLPYPVVASGAVFDRRIAPTAILVSARGCR